MDGMRRRDDVLRGGFSPGLKIFQPRITRMGTNEDDGDCDLAIPLIPFIPSSLPAAEGTAD